MIGASQIRPTQPKAARTSRLLSTTWAEATTTTRPWTTTNTQGQTVERNQSISSAMLGGRRFSDELADLLELGRAGPAAPFEERRFGGRQRRAGRIHSPQGDLVIEMAACADRIGRHIDPKSFTQQ